MAELVVPCTTAEIIRRIPLSRSSPKPGPVHSRVRSNRWAALWRATWPAASRGEFQLIRRTYVDGAFGAAETLWTPPGGSGGKYLMQRLQAAQRSAQHFTVTAELLELLSSDT